MSQEKVEIVRQGIEAFNRRDVDAFVAEPQSDVEWEGAGARLATRLGATALEPGAVTAAAGMPGS
jgi:hypothetical protein